MGRAPCCSKVGLHRGPWTSKEDSMLTDYIKSHGEGHWRSLPKQAGLLRCGKSCRLRWMNYLRPDIKRGNITAQEDDLIIRLHSLLGNRWSLIAGRLPGRTDNEIKNYWNTRLSKKIPTTLASPPKKTTSSAATHANKQSNPVIPVSKLTPALEIEIKHMVHQPKPVRVGLIKNMSGLVLTSESNNNTNYLDSSSFSGENIMSIYNSSSEEGDQEVDDVLAVAAGNNGSDAAWTDEDIYNGIYGDVGMDGAGSVELFMSGRSEYDARNNNNGVWERLYEEYQQLTNDGGQVEWQPEEESLLI